MQLQELTNKTTAICQNIERVIVGKSEQVQLALAAMLAGGHVLLQDVPGTGKTMLAKALAKSFDLGFGRVQFTPDLLPSELTGINFYSPKTGEFSFREGSLFTNILLADEINRATPRTQSGLLESMEELQITVDGTTYPLPRPYFVIATQNPVETQGTFPLPEAQLDRFLIQLTLGYPTAEESRAVLQSFIAGQPLEELYPVCSGEDFAAMQAVVQGVYLHPDILDYIIALAGATRAHEEVALGISTRGCIALARLAQSYAAMQGRAFATPDDIRLLAPYVFTHRLILHGSRGHEAARRLVEGVLRSVEVPVEDWQTKP